MIAWPHVGESKVDTEEAKRLREAGLSLQEIGNTFGVTRERIRQIVGNVKALCPACGHRRNREKQDYCFKCRAKLLKTERPRKPCKYCGEPGGWKLPVCKKHRNKYNYDQNPLKRFLWAEYGKKWREKNREKWLAGMRERGRKRRAKQKAGEGK